VSPSSGGDKNGDRVGGSGDSQHHRLRDVWFSSFESWCIDVASGKQCRHRYAGERQVWDWIQTAYCKCNSNEQRARSSGILQKDFMLLKPLMEKSDAAEGKKRQKEELKKQKEE
jgi:hypothetical protein